MQCTNSDISEWALKSKWRVGSIIKRKMEIMEEWWKDERKKK